MRFIELLYLLVKHAFHRAAGREDVDVRMLGNGRPFVITLCGAATVTPGERLNSAFNGQHFVQPANGTLTYVTDEDTAIIRDGEAGMLLGALSEDSKTQS